VLLVSHPAHAEWLQLREVQEANRAKDEVDRQQQTQNKLGGMIAGFVQHYQQLRGWKAAHASEWGTARTARSDDDEVPRIRCRASLCSSDDDDDDWDEECVAEGCAAAPDEMMMEPEMMMMMESEMARATACAAPLPPPPAMPSSSGPLAPPPPSGPLAPPPPQQQQQQQQHAAAKTAAPQPEAEEEEEEEEGALSRASSLASLDRQSSAGEEDAAQPAVDAQGREAYLAPIREALQR
jgi:hypothetical protein